MNISEKKLAIIRALIDLETAVEKVIPKSVIRKHKKHLFRKECELCHREFQVKQGLAVHMWKKHPVESSLNR